MVISILDIHPDGTQVLRQEEIPTDSPIASTTDQNQ